MQAVIFDMNGVIVDDMEYHIVAWKEFAAKRGKIISDEEFDKMLAGRNNIETIRYIVSPDISDEEAYELSEEKEKIYRERYLPEMKLLPGLADFLEELTAAKIPCAVGTAAPIENSKLVLDGLNIRHYFGAVVDASQVKNGKPAPDLFLEAARRLNVPNTECVVFEDSVLGLNAAHSANMKAVGVMTTHPKEKLPYIVDAIKDFREMNLKRLKQIV